MPNRAALSTLVLAIAVAAVAPAGASVAALEESYQGCRDHALGAADMRWGYYLLNQCDVYWMGAANAEATKGARIKARCVFREGEALYGRSDLKPADRKAIDRTCEEEALAAIDEERALVPDGSSY